MNDSIIAVGALEVYDSRGKPTVEAEVRLSGGAVGRAMVPSGASVGRHEALELRDGGARLRGQGVRGAVAAVREVLGPLMLGRPASDQQACDAALVAADGTPNRGHLGGNALLAVSLAVLRAAAAALSVPLWRHVADLVGTAAVLPLPMVNIISGGRHAEGGADVQDFLFVPVGAADVRLAIEQAIEVRLAAADILRQRGASTLLADEGGFGPRLATNSEGLDLLGEALHRAGLRRATDAGIAVDVAASQLWQDGGYVLDLERRRLDASGMGALMEEWVGGYPLVSLEDPLGEDDWEGWRRLSRRLGDRVQLVGDDLFATQADRLDRGIAEGVANAILVKCNQVGTVSEALEVVARAKRAGYRTILSARSGETEDSWLADLAVGCGAGQIKVGATRTSERLSKYNQLLRIAEQMGPGAPYAGRGALAGK